MVQTAPEEHPDAAPAPARPRPVRPGADGAVTPRGSRSTSTRRVDRGRTAGRRAAGVEPAADLLLLNDGDLTYAKIRLDAAPPPRCRPMLPLAAPTRWPGRWSGPRRSTRCATASGRWTTWSRWCVAALPAETGGASSSRTCCAPDADGLVDRYLRRRPARAAALRPRRGRPADRAARRRAAPAAVTAARRGPWLHRAPDRPTRARLRGLARRPGRPGRLWRRRRPALDDAVPAGRRWARPAPAEIDAEAARDRSATGAEQAARCRAALPRPGGQGARLAA